MRRLIATILILVLSQGVSILAHASDVVLVTWNMRWFPSGKADLRISPEFEDFKMRKASGVLTNAIAAVGGTETNGVVICAQEVRDRFVSQRLGEMTGFTNLKAVAVSDFTDKAGIPIWQQLAILSNMSLVEGGSMPWQSERNVDMPRGFVYAVLGEGGGANRCFLCSFEIKFELVWFRIGNTKKHIQARICCRSNSDKVPRDGVSVW